jgi:hypothetical protein
MATSTRAWQKLVNELASQMPPDWTTRAREDAEQDWIRLILLVDAHHRLSMPSVDEKIAQTLGELAGEREPEAAGWREVAARAHDAREARRDALLTAAPDVLAREQAELFDRSIEPVARV